MYAVYPLRITKSRNPLIALTSLRMVLVCTFNLFPIWFRTYSFVNEITPSSGSAKSRRKRRIQPSSVFRLNPRACRYAIYCSNSIFEVIPISSIPHKTTRTYARPEDPPWCIRKSFWGCCAQEYWRSSSAVCHHTKDCLPEYDAVNGLLCVSLLSCPRISCIA